MNRLNPTYLLLVLLPIFWTNSNLNAKVNTQDSLALVDLYNSTDGDNWAGNTNWLTTEVVNWYGISTVVIGGERRVRQINLPDNNLVGEIDQSVINDLSKLWKININRNYITSIPNFKTSSSLKYISVKYNNLTFGDLELNLPSNSGVNFTYFPQANEYGEELYIEREPGDMYVMKGDAGGSSTQYTWYRVGLGSIGSGSVKNISPLTPSKAGDYYCVATSNHPSLTGMTMVRKQVHLTVQNQACTDNTGATIECDELIVQYLSGLTSAQKQSFLNKYGFTEIKTCPCTDVELIALPWNMTIERGKKSVEEDDAMEDEGGGFNYKGLTLYPQVGGDNINFNPGVIAAPAKKDDVVVAVIDSGVDFRYPPLNRKIWLNPKDQTRNLVDDEPNCYTDDVLGWNFLTESNSAILDNNGHGTAIANIIYNRQPVVNKVRIMNLKAFDAYGQSNLFSPLCAIYYAANKGVDVINLSWGYVGEASGVLKNAIAYAGTEADAIVVTSSGNEHSDNADPTMFHFPSNYELDNLISVGAYDNNPGASFGNWWVQSPGLIGSNYSDVNVDLAAPGVRIPAMTMGGIGPIYPTGTSMAAAYLSGEIAKMIEANPDATFRSLKHCVLESVTIDSKWTKLANTSGKLDPTGFSTCLTGFVHLTETKALLNLKVMLEGPINYTGKMVDNLRADKLLPKYQPYNVEPWFYDGSESVSATFFGVQPNTNHNIVDWVLVKFLDPDNENNNQTVAALVRRDGQVINTSGGLIELPENICASYVSVVHRNHLGVMTEDKISLDYLPTEVDFTKKSTPTFGKNAQKNKMGMMMLYKGNAVPDSTINAADGSEIQNNFGSGNLYENTDINMNGKTENYDRSASLLNQNKTTECFNCHKE